MSVSSVTILLRFYFPISFYILAYSTIDFVIEALKHEKVKGILIDSYVAAEHKDKLKGFKNQMVIEHISNYGIVFLNEGLRYSSCIRDYVYSRQNEISDIIRNSVTLLEVSNFMGSLKLDLNIKHWLVTLLEVDNCDPRPY